MSTYVGVNVAEVDGLASPTIVPAATSVAAFVGVTERGPLNTSVRVSDLDQFASRFGGVIPTAYLAYAVLGFFRNGGREAHICRIAGSASAAASLVLQNRAAAPAATLRLEGGYRGQTDPGHWAERIRVDVRDDPRATTTLASVAAANATSAKLTSAKDIVPGSVLRFNDAAAAPVAQARKVTSVDPDGTVHWTDPVVAGIANGAAVSTAEFRLVVRYRTSANAPIQTVEDWRWLSMESDSSDYVVDRLDHPFTGSRYLVATDVGSSTVPSGFDVPAPAVNQELKNGNDAAPVALDFAGNTAAHTGFSALDGDSVQLLAAPDLHILTLPNRQLVVGAALDYCAGRGDLMFVGSTPDRALRGGIAVARSRGDYGQRESEYAQTTIAFSKQFQAPKVYGALYTPWVRVADPAATAGASPTRFVPPEGYVMGIYARTDLERGIWKAPAGISATVRGALDVSADFTDGQHDDLVRNGFTNGIRPAPGIGISVAASRTLSTDPRWWYVNIRLLFNFVKSSLRDGLRFVRQQPNSGELRRRVKFNVVTPFLLNLWRRGAFGSDDAKNVFTVHCDDSNNPPSEVDLGNFHIDVTFYPVRPAETVVIKVGQQPTGSSASES